MHLRFAVFLVCLIIFDCFLQRARNAITVESLPTTSLASVRNPKKLAATSAEIKTTWLVTVRTRRMEKTRSTAPEAEEDSEVAEVPRDVTDATGRDTLRGSVMLPEIRAVDTTRITRRVMSADRQTIWREIAP